MTKLTAEDESSSLQSTSGPWGTPVTDAPSEPQLDLKKPTRFRSFAGLFIVLFAFAVPAYKDLSRPEAWAYWKDLYVSPSLTSVLISKAYTDASGRNHPAMLVSGTIGAAAAKWFRDQIDEAHLVMGDAIFLTSPGGDLNQALIMGEIIRSKGLVTAVAKRDSSGTMRASYCASACVLVFAGGEVRIGFPGSKLGVHRFTTVGGNGDPISLAQRTAGLVLGYLTRMGISPSIAEAMSSTSDIQWLPDKLTVESRLVSNPLAGY